MKKEVVGGLPSQTVTRTNEYSGMFLNRTAVAQAAPPDSLQTFSRCQVMAASAPTKRNGGLSAAVPCIKPCWGLDYIFVLTDRNQLRPTTS